MEIYLSFSYWMFQPYFWVVLGISIIIIDVFFIERCRDFEMYSFKMLLPSAAQPIRKCANQSMATPSKFPHIPSYSISENAIWNGVGWRLGSRRPTYSGWRGAAASHPRISGGVWGSHQATAVPIPPMEGDYYPIQNTMLGFLKK